MPNRRAVARREESQRIGGRSSARPRTWPARKAVSQRKTPRLKLAIAAQSSLFREVLAGFLDKAPGLEVVGQARDEDQIGKILSGMNPRVLVFDYEALRPLGEAAIARLHRAAPGTRILVLATHPNEDTVQRVLRAGGSGVVGKQLCSATLVRAIHAVAAGEVWADRQTVAQILERLADSRRAAVSGPGSASAPESHLTKREWEVVGCVGRGFRNKEIARRLSISEKTVKSHLNNIFRKLQVDNRFAVGLYALGQTRI